MSRNSLAVKSLIPLTIACGAFALGIIAFAQQPAQPEAKGKAEKTKKRLPPLFFREDWQETKGVPVEHPVTQAAVATPTLDIKLYGPSGKDIVENGLPNNADNPPHLWTGLCTSTCAAALRDRNNYVDLTGLAKIRWLIHTSGFHEVRPVVKLADGTWLVGDHGDATTQDYPTSSKLRSPRFAAGSQDGYGRRSSRGATCSTTWISARWMRSDSRISCPAAVMATVDTPESAGSKSTASPLNAISRWVSLPLLDVISARD